MTGNRIQEFGEPTGGWMGDVTSQAKEWASEFGHDAEARLKAACADATDLIRRYPVATLLAGFTVGLLLARVTLARR